MKEIGGNQSGDAENKRPPWRAVSVSTLPKPDKNAILRAKLLDASRYLYEMKKKTIYEHSIYVFIFRNCANKFKQGYR